MLKKILSLGVAAMLVITSMVTPVLAADFKDDIKGNQILKENNLSLTINNDNDNRENHKSLSNIEALKMIIDGLDLDGDAKAVTTLHPSYRGGKIYSSTYYKYIYIAIEKGILLEAETKAFSPYSSIKRYEASKYLIRAVGLESEAQKYMNAELDFNDAKSVPSSYIGYVYLANKYNLFEVEKKVFQPAKTLSKTELENAIKAAKDLDSSDVIDVPDKDVNSNAYTFVSLNTTKTKITVLTKDGKTKEYTINAASQVYFDSKYVALDYLKSGDTIRLIFDHDNTQVILIELLSQIRFDEQISFTTMNYNDLPAIVQTQVDTIKLNENYAAFRYGNYIYLIATRGQKNTGGYDINIKNIYKVLSGNGNCDIKAVVEKVDPASGSYTTQAITYPYEVVRFSYFKGIQNVKFVDLNDNSIAQTVVTTLTDTAETYEQLSAAVIQYTDLPDLIKTQVDTLKLSENYAAYKYGSYIYLIAARGQKTTSGYDINIKNVYKVIQSNGNCDIKAYIEKIDPASGSQTTQIINYPYEVVRFSYFNNIQTVKFVDLNGNSIAQTVLTTLADATETISGTIYSVDAAHSKLYVTTAKVTTVYTIPTSAAITLNGATSNISSLAANMNVVITKINNVITAVYATDNIVETSGTLLAKSTVNNATTLFVQVGTEYKAYPVDATTVFKLKGEITTLDQIPLNSGVILREVNGILKEVRA